MTLFPSHVEDMASEVAESQQQHHSDNPEAYRVGSIIGHRINNAHDLDGKPIAGKMDYFKIKWTGYQNPTWEPATCFDVGQHQAKFNKYLEQNKTHIAARRARTPSNLNSNRLSESQTCSMLNISVELSQ